MNHAYLARRAVLAALTGILLALAAAPAAMAQPWPHPHSPVPPAQRIQTIVEGGTPGWQITLIAVGAAILAAALAVAIDRARRTRRVRATTA